MTPIESATPTQLRIHAAARERRAKFFAKPVAPEPTPIVPEPTPPALPVKAAPEYKRLVLLAPDDSASLPELTVRQIQDCVCKTWNISRVDICSARRSHSIVHPRQIAMAITKTLMTKSMPEIGRRFGGRDHTTVLHATRKYQWIMSLLLSELGIDAPLERWVMRSKELAEGAAT